MTTNDFKCPNCNSRTTVSINENTRGKELTWSASYRCSKCEYAEEVDGIGQLPDNLRQIVLENNGVWQLVLESMGNEPAKCLKALKTVFGLTSTELSALKANLPAIVHSGTKAEADFYNSRLIDSYEAIGTVLLFI